MEELIDRFEAVSDDGQQFTVDVYQDVTTTRTLNGAASQIRGLKRVALSDGRDVNRIDEKTFKIVSTDQVIRKV